MRDLIRQKIVDALALPVPDFTRRTVRLPGVPGKAVAVIGPRRAGKTTFLWQVLADRLAFCRFSYLVSLNPGGQPAAPKWQPAAPGSAWPLAIRVEMAPLEPNPSQLQPITVTAPIYVHRSPKIEYDDY